MKLRNQRSVLRHKKYRKDTETHPFMYSELLLFHPWREERELSPDDFESCLALYESKRASIEKVKNILFPHQNNIEQGRALIELLGDARASHIGDELDAEHEQLQENDGKVATEMDANDVVRYPDDLVSSHDDANERNSSGIYRRIDISDPATMAKDVQKLDDDQRLVFDFVLQYIRDVRKMTDIQLGKRAAPPLVVYGGAGTGKSTLIRIIAKWTESTLRCDDDRHPDQPFILLTAPTGTATKNIDGLTLHSAFNMPFGNTFKSLGDKKRDQKRNELSRLKIRIVDEFSMVKADMLYQLNLRLKEIKQNDKDFGGVAVILFGDLMQLRPVQARYIFQKPKDNKFALSFLVRSLWKQFDIVKLQQNHRQGKDGVYADILNRIRFANHTENDMELLRARVSQSLPVEAIHLFGTNAEVNNFN